MRLAEQHRADLEQQDPKTQALFRLIFAVYERADRHADRQEQDWKGILKEAASILSGIDKVRLEQLLAQQFDAERQKP